MSALIRLWFWLFISRAALAVRHKETFLRAIEGVGDATKRMKVAFPDQDFSKLENAVLELKKAMDE